MQTKIHPELSDFPQIKEAEDILRACVHCGFCTATCPTYQHFGDERDGPRGRIYLIKQVLETSEATEKTQGHLDRCLSCRSCETTCPSGVRYGRLVDIGRDIVDDKVQRPIPQRVLRWALRKVLPYPKRFSFLLFWGQLFRPVFPKVLKQKIPTKQTPAAVPLTVRPRTMLALAGCVQSVATPNTNAAAARVLYKLGINLQEVPRAGCCGAVDYHLSARNDGLDAMRKNIDAWWPAIESGAEAIVMTASACGAMVKEYGELLADDPAYANKAKRVSALAKDISEILCAEDLSALKIQEAAKTAVHCPCTLQHGQALSGSVETILTKLGVPLAATKDKHLCCGSAGTYSILQSNTSQQLLENKLAALSIDQPDQIVTANIGCQMHLATQSKVAVKHWIELLDW